MTPEHAASRLGYATASNAAAIMAKGKDGKPSATRANYAWELALERVTGAALDSFSNEHTERGETVEPEARRAFEAATGILMLEVPFQRHPTLPWVGASPDGLTVDGREGMEAKCRLPKGHGKALFGQGVVEVQKQMDFQMWVCGLEAVWFVSYCAAFPPELRLHYERVARSEERIAVIEAEVLAFLPVVARLELQIRGMIDERKAAA